MKKTTLASFAALLGYSIFGVSFLFSKIALEQASPFVLLAVRFPVAFLLLNLAILLFRIPFSLKGKPVKMLLLLGFVQPVVYFICENYGIAMTTTSFSGLMLGTIPVFGLLLGRIILKARITPFQWGCAICSICGVALTCAGGEVGFSALGIILLLSAAVASSLFTVLSTGLADKFTAVERTYIILALGCAVFPVIALVQNRSDLSSLLIPLRSPSFWGAVLYLACLSSVGAFFLLNFAVSHISIARSCVFSNFSTVISVLVGIVVMGDAFSPAQLAGVVIITLSVLGTSLPSTAANDVAISATSGEKSASV